MARPVLYVLAGVNGAGKSSIGGHVLAQQGLPWFNPDDFARALMARTGCRLDEANQEAWKESVRRLELAIDGGVTHAFETTLGGRTVPSRIRAATGRHDVMIWFCGLSSPEHHIARVGARVATGGHDIPEALIRRRYLHAQQHLIELMPHLAHLQVYDNSADTAVGEAVPDPVLVMQMKGGHLTWPGASDAQALGMAPSWAKPLVEAALLLG